MSIAIYIRCNDRPEGNVVPIYRQSSFSGAIGVIKYNAEEPLLLFKMMLFDLRTMFQNGLEAFPREIPHGFDEDHRVWVMEAEILKAPHEPVDMTHIVYTEAGNAWIAHIAPSAIKISRT